MKKSTTGAILAATLAAFLLSGCWGAGEEPAKAVRREAISSCTTAGATEDGERLCPARGESRLGKPGQLLNVYGVPSARTFFFGLPF